MENDTFIFCLEAVADIEEVTATEVAQHLEKLAFDKGISSIHTTCDSIEGLEERLHSLLYDDHNFTNYEIIYLVMQGEANTICLNNYFYTLEEIAELFEGKMRGKIIHFASTKALDLTPDESQYFLDITCAKAISGYGSPHAEVSSTALDQLFFSLFEADDSIFNVVEELHQKQYELCKFLDFRMYY